MKNEYNYIIFILFVMLMYPKKCEWLCG